MTVLAEFATPDSAHDALRALTSLGYRHLETYSPYALTSDQARAVDGSFPLGALAFGGGVVALAAAYLIQWYANVQSYPLNIGGRPVHAAPAFVPTTFETICLVASAMALVGFLLLERLPRLWQSLFDIEGFERTAVDRFWISLDLPDGGAIDRITEDLAEFSPLRIVVGEEET